VTPRLGAAALIVAALAVGTVIESGTPDTDTAERPFITRGTMGKPVDVHTFDATVLGVRGATKISRSQRPTDKGARDTGGVWVLVRVRVVATQTTMSVGWAGVVDRRGRTFHATTRIDQPLVASHRQLQPGIPVVGEVAFEVPRDAADSLTLQIAEKPLDRRMSAMAEVPLRITKAAVDGWVADAGTAVLTEPEVTR
jgi:hypothetical protein